jgi:hypothetical protein
VQADGFGPAAATLAREIKAAAAGDETQFERAICSIDDTINPTRVFLGGTALLTVCKCCLWRCCCG